MLDAVSPHLIVFDCFPHKPLARCAIDRGIPIVFCVRRMRSPEQYLNAVREWLPHVRRFIIPHEADEHASPAAHGRCEDARPHAEGPAVVPVGGSSPTSDPPQHD